MAEPAQGLSYESLQEMLRAERRSNKLMPVAARFWSEVRQFLSERLEAFRVEQAKDPFSRRVMLLTDEVKNARHAAESLWALRERKLAILALSNTKDAKKPEGLIPDDAMLFSRILEALTEARVRTFGSVLDNPNPEAVPAAPGPTESRVPHAASTRPSAMGPARAIEPPQSVPAATPVAPATPATANEAEVDPVKGPSAPQSVPHDTQAGASHELVTIRALGDIPPFVGPDMHTYLLKEGDIATVPPSIARLLEKRKKAAIIATG